MGSDNDKKTTGSNFSFNRIMLKAKYSFYSTLVFFIFANPETFIVLQQMFGKYVTFMSNGMQTINGVFINTGLFFLTMLGLMLLPQD